MQADLFKRPIYLAKIMAVVALTAALMAAAIIAGAMRMDEHTRILTAGALTLPFVFIYPAVWWLHLRVDEMLQLIHYRACVFSACASATLMGSVGVLQANQFIGELNFFYGFICIVSTWAIGLMLADWKHY